MRNLRLAFRTLFRAPFITVVAIVSIALGIGANAAIYSLFNELLLAPLPVPHPEQLVVVGGNTPTPGSHQTTGAGGDSKWVFSYRMLRDFQAQPGPFSGVAGHEDFSANVAFNGNTEVVTGEWVTGSYFPVLGVTPALGRLIGQEDDRTIGDGAVVVLSHDYWATELGGNPAIIGQRMLVEGQPLTIIGIAPAGFTGTTLGSTPSVYVPITMRGVLTGFTHWDDRRQYWVYVFARLGPGVTLAHAAAQENVLFRRIVNTVEAPLQQGISPNTLARFKAKTLELVDGRRGSSDLHETTSAPLMLLLGITMFVLAIACANVANLLLARAANRSVEIAVRLSLGATRARLLAQLLLESMLLAALGGAAGLFVAWATLRGIVVILPARVASTLSFTLSPAAIGFAATLTMTTGVLFGLFPALHSTRPDLASTLRDGSGKTSATRSATRFRTSLVTAQIALSMALLVSAGLVIRSLENVSRVALGFDVDALTTFRIAPVMSGYSGARSAQLFAQMESDLAAIPGVRRVSAARVPLVAGNNWDNGVAVQGFPKTPDTDADAYFNGVGPGFFATIGEPVIAGREFTEADAFGAPRVVVVNESFVKKFKLGSPAAAVGKMMGQGDSLTHEIIGVVKDAKYSGVKQQNRPVYYQAYKQDTTAGFLAFYVRSSLPSKVLIAQIRSRISRIDPNLPMMGLQTMSQQVKDNVYLDRMITMLSAAFAMLATVLAAIGLYGVLAYSVAQRTKEIGVRMALGADSGSIVAMVMRSVGGMTIAGALIGTGAALAIGRAMQSLLFGVEGRDPFVMIAAAAVLGVVAMAAGAAPAWRATKVDPVRALKYE